MAKYLLFFQCAILLSSFKGIVGPKMDFVIKNFGKVDIYSVVKVEGDNETGQFIFDKDNTAHSYRQLVVPFAKIRRDTLIKEGNNPTIVSFYIEGEKNANYNIKFRYEWQADLYVKNKTLPYVYEITWARIYENWRPVIIAYFHLSDKDMGFKILENENDPDLNARLSELPFIFKRSEMNTAMRTKPPLTLYMRNIKRSEDYEIVFSSLDNMTEFRKLFPGATYNEHYTIGYYQMR